MIKSFRVKSGSAVQSAPLLVFLFVLAVVCSNSYNLLTPPLGWNAACAPVFPKKALPGVLSESAPFSKGSEFVQKASSLWAWESVEVLLCVDLAVSDRETEQAATPLVDDLIN